MTKEITKARILQEIQDKFQLRELMPEKFAFSEMVIPTYDIEPHLLTWVRETKTLSIPANAAYLFYTVPANEQWTLRAYQVTFIPTGGFNVSGVFIGRPSASDYIYLDLTADQAVSYIKNLPVLVTLHPGHTLHINVSGYTSTQNLRLDLDVQKEEIR